MHVWGARIASAFKVCLLLIWIANQINLLEVLLRAIHRTMSSMRRSSAQVRVQIYKFVETWTSGRRLCSVLQIQLSILCLHLDFFHIVLDNSHRFAKSAFFCSNFEAVYSKQFVQRNFVALYLFGENQFCSIKWISNCQHEFRVFFKIN